MVGVLLFVTAFPAGGWAATPGPHVATPISLTYAKMQLRLYAKSVYEVVREPLLSDCGRHGTNYVRCDVSLDIVGSRHRCGRASLREIGSTDYMRLKVHPC